MGVTTYIPCSDELIITRLPIDYQLTSLIVNFDLKKTGFNTNNGAESDIFYKQLHIPRLSVIMVESYRSIYWISLILCCRGQFKCCLNLTQEGDGEGCTTEQCKSIMVPCYRLPEGGMSFFRKNSVT